MESIRKRWSPRKYKDQAISKEDLTMMMEAAQWAPSAYNEQPWRFLYGEKGSAMYEKILEALVPFNQEWASTAPLLMIVLSAKNLARNGKFNPHHAYDTGAAVMNMTLQAADLDIYSRQMGGILYDKIREDFQVSEAYEVICALAFGYTEEDFPEGRERKDLDQIFFTNWNN